MSLHNGSSRMAHNLDRFSFDNKFEQVAADAARLQVMPDTIRIYLDWYGEELVTVASKCGMKSMPAYEAEIRWQVLGEKVRILKQMALPFATTNQYAHELRGW